MIRVLTILAAIAALAVSAGPANAVSRGHRTPAETMSVSAKASPPKSSLHENEGIDGGFKAKTKSRPQAVPRKLNDVEGIDFAVKDGTSNTTVFAERGASFTIDIGTSEAAHHGNVKPPTPRANLAHVRGGSNGIIAVLIGSVSAASDGTSNTLAFAERSSGNTMQNAMISGHGVSNSRQGLLYNGHAGLGANTAGAPQSRTAATSQGIIMRDGGVCDPIRHMGC